MASKANKISRKLTAVVTKEGRHFSIGETTRTNQTVEKINFVNSNVNPVGKFVEVVLDGDTAYWIPEEQVERYVLENA